MSRTYRNRGSHRAYYRVMVEGWLFYLDKYEMFTEANRAPTKKELALGKCDGVKNESLHWWFNQCDRKNRREARRNFQLLKTYEDYEDFSYDPSKYTKKYKGIWWEIY